MSRSLVTQEDIKHLEVTIKKKIFEQARNKADHEEEERHLKKEQENVFQDLRTLRELARKFQIDKRNASNMVLPNDTELKYKCQELILENRRLTREIEEDKKKIVVEENKIAAQKKAFEQIHMLFSQKAMISRKFRQNLREYGIFFYPVITPDNKRIIIPKFPANRKYLPLFVQFD